MSKAVVKQQRRVTDMSSSRKFRWLLLYWCFTTVLLLLYYCFTHALGRLTSRRAESSAYCCFTDALLLLYWCFTTALLLALRFTSSFEASERCGSLLLLYWCFTTALLMLYYCFTDALLLLYWFTDALRWTSSRDASETRSSCWLNLYAAK